PDSESIEPDVENLQVIGFASGNDVMQALENLLGEEPDILATTFNNLVCFELRHDDYVANAAWLELDPFRRATPR
ncbi:MAG: hypothetical protein ACJ78Q_05035, partial [Chloroflexia bacterium]